MKRQFGTNLLQTMRNGKRGTAGRIELSGMMRFDDLDLRGREHLCRLLRKTDQKRHADGHVRRKKQGDLPRRLFDRRAPDLVMSRRCHDERRIRAHCIIAKRPDRGSRGKIDNHVRRHAAFFQ